MTPRRLIEASLRHYWRANLGLLLGVLVAAAVLTGALAVGDSVRASLRRHALQRLGWAGHALAAGDRFLPETPALAEFRDDQPPHVVPLLLLRGSASGDSARAGDVQIIGVRGDFWALADRPLAPEVAQPFQAVQGAQAGKPVPPDLPDDGVVLNRRLAGRLQAKVGDWVTLRALRPTRLPREAGLNHEPLTAGFRARVAAIADDDQLGPFNLESTQLPASNAFIPLATLQKRIDQPGRANLYLTHAAEDTRFGGGSWGFNPEMRFVRLEDLELELRKTARGQLELRSRRMFLEVEPDALDPTPQARVFTWFVNELRLGEKATPYSFVAAIQADPGTMGGLPADLRDDEIVINQWLADDLGAKVSDRIELKYYVLGPLRGLEQKSRAFRVRAVLPMADPLWDRQLMPDIPGLTDSASCRDWKSGLPIDTGVIRDKDEEYWKRLGGTPKAVVSLKAGQEMWASRYGQLTALRWTLGEPETALRSRIEGSVLKQLPPERLGLVFQPVRERALKAASQAVDFAQLFLGLSSFLLVAAALLAALLLVLAVQQRLGEVGTLLAVGLPPRRVRNLLLLELLAVAGAGAVAGCAAGLLYTWAVLHGLATVWRPAVGGADIALSVSPLSLLLSLVATMALAAGAGWLTLRRQLRRNVRELLAGGGEEAVSPPGRRPYALIVALVCGGAGAAVLAVWTLRHATGAMPFFLAGALLLVAGLALCRWLLGTDTTGVSRSTGVSVAAATLSPVKNAGKPAETQKHGQDAHATHGRDARATHGRDAHATLSLPRLALRNAARRRFRSLAVIGLLACGTFLVVAVGAQRRTAGSLARADSPTGGFDLLANLTVPLPYDPAAGAGRKALGLDKRPDVQVVPLRLHEGDDASCLNLNRAQSPRLLGVPSDDPAWDARFHFARATAGLNVRDGWRLLEARTATGPGGVPVVPAAGDESTVTWALGRKLGDELDYVGRDGQRFRVRIVAILDDSILQGHLMISRRHFEGEEPLLATEGYARLLVQLLPLRGEGREGVSGDPSPGLRPTSPSGRGVAVAAAMRRAGADLGIEITPAPQRLAELYAIQNTYLSVFQSLGAMGLLLGSAGLALVVMRNILERRAELALLRAVGYSAGAVRRLVLGEHWALLAAGLAVGAGAGLAAVAPVLRANPLAAPWALLAAAVLGAASAGAMSVWLSARWAMSGPLLAALRSE